MMNYSMFCFHDLYRINDEEYRDADYDVQYDLLHNEFKKFLKSDYNVDTQSEIDCMNDYFNARNLIYPEGTILYYKDIDKSMSAKRGAKVEVVEGFRKGDRFIHVNFLDELGNGQECGGYFLYQFQEEKVPTQKELEEEQKQLFWDVQNVAKVNIVTCGHCESVILHERSHEGSLTCHSCLRVFDQSDCPDLWC